MMDFRPFLAAVVAQFALMSKHELFRLTTSGDKIWEIYLGAFPEGTNPVFKTKTEHDGSYDRHFVRDLGNVVMINPDGSHTSIWDAKNLQAPYAEVCAKISAYLAGDTIDGLFRTDQRQIGHAPNTIQLPDGRTHQFHHFLVPITPKHLVTGSKSVDTVLGEANSRVHVFLRGLHEIKPEAIATVLDLMEQKVLYRGDEFEASVRAFQMLQQRFDGTTQFAWANFSTPAAGLRNTVIGTLLTDISEGMPVEQALRAFEQKVAPANYKRPTAAITPAMITQATKTIQEMGLEKSLERRFAKLSDLSVNNVIWVDNSARALMKDGLTALLEKEIKPTVKFTPKEAAEISADDFITKVLPTALTLEVYFPNPLQSNLVSLTAPVHADAPALFKWDSNFGWSYNGNIADSIKEKVKAAGGNTNAALRVSLAWYNSDDLDIHAHCPDGHVYFCQKAGILDVDMNAGGRMSRTPVENLSWIKPRNGKYEIRVNQFNRRETTDIGFTIEVENAGSVTQYSYPKAVSGFVRVIDFTIKDMKITDLVVHPGITGQGIQQHRWGVATEQFVKVSTVLHSPNHWDGNETGNKHTFFILEGCLNDGPARGIYNEFLKPELEAHRKVFEILGNKLKCPVVPEQLSGLGFSSTKRETVTFKVSTASSTRMYAVQF